MIVARTRPLRAEVRLIQRFDESFTQLWEQLAPKFDFAVRRDAAYLNWKFATAPHVRYTIAALVRDGKTAGYAVYRHVHEPRGRVTLLVDFLADPDDEAGIATLLHWIDREARQADSDKIRAFALHAGFRKALKRAGYFQVKSTMEFVIKINGVDVTPDVLREHRSLARHARRLGSGPIAGHASTRRHRYRRRQPVGRRGAGGPAVREHLRAAAPARAVRAARRAADLRHHAIRSRPTRDRPTCCAALQAGGDCEIGAHHHAWETPPCTAEDVTPPSLRVEPAACAQFEDQLASLTDAIERAVGGARSRIAPAASASPPRTCRRSRRLGYLVESSVAPLFYEAHKNGPDFVEAPLTPVLPRLRQRDAARHQRPARGAGLGRAATADCRRRLQYLYARAPRNVHDQARAAEARRRARALAAPVVFVARRHDRARPPTSPPPASRCSTCSSIRARRSSAAARTTGPRRSSPPSAIASSASSSTRRGALRRCRRPSAEFRDAAYVSVMRIVHVTPHLPPDQAANALLPFQLGEWAASAGRRGHTTSRIPRRRRTAPQPARRRRRSPWRGPGAAYCSARCASDRSPARGASRRVAEPLIACRRHRPRPQQRPAAGGAARGSRIGLGKPVVLTLYGTEIWHYRAEAARPDLFTRAYTRRRRRSRSTAGGCSSGRASSASIARACTSSIRRSRRRSRATTPTAQRRERAALGHHGARICSSTSSGCTRSPASATCSRRCRRCCASIPTRTSSSAAPARCCRSSRLWHDPREWSGT